MNIDTMSVNECLLELDARLSALESRGPAEPEPEPGTVVTAAADMSAAALDSGAAAELVGGAE